MDPDYNLIQQCQSSDSAVYEKAFFSIYRKYGDRAYNIAYRILGNSEDALDVTQEAFLTLFKKVEDFRKDSRFFTWFYRIIVNLSIDRKRKQATMKCITRSDSDWDIAEFPDPRVETDIEVNQEEFLDTKVQASFMKLSPNLRVITVLRYIEGLSYAEIAETLTCSIGTVKSRLNRAHRSLEAYLEPLIQMRRKAPGVNATGNKEKD